MCICMYVCAPNTKGVEMGRLRRNYTHTYCMYTCMYVCMYACEYVCMYISISIYVHTHTHTHIYIRLTRAWYAASFRLREKARRSLSNLNQQRKGQSGSKGTIHTVHIQRGHERTRAGNRSESGVGSLRGAPLNISRFTHMYIYIDIYTCLYACMYVCMYASMYVRSARSVASFRPQAKARRSRSAPTRKKELALKEDNTHTYMYFYTCMYACMYVCEYVCRYISLSMYLYTRIFIYVYIYIYIYIYRVNPRMIRGVGSSSSERT